MSIPFDADLTIMLSPDEHGVNVTFEGAIIKGIFDNETVPGDAGGIVPVHEEQPRFTCRTTDVSSIAFGNTMIINSINYKVRAFIHDGTGVTDVQLEKQ